ncbi:LysM peptidoglycan-binding domain-containing protein [Oerskovia sp. Sa1BUA8]|uniref:LysM peptidoglycan-binding domain-containing protein n=1 Tax=Oerskovia douganii TaxID=2762210 RepID=A0A9D5YZ94_9CELL|nr:LysM peptidoglycan-binding domain-containing protein [Oerskovia douganii]MBE7700717.1 LysM peptidoglycan-binding domain-containing protein [Oerskovia douganii]
MAAATGGIAAVLTLRTLDLLADLPSPRFETYLEVPLVGAGALLATWVAVTSMLAASCVLARAAGRRWSAGEQLVLRHAPSVVRRLASAGVAVSIGTGLALGGGSAHAAEVEPPADSARVGPAVVDLGWQTTAQGPSDRTSVEPPGPGPSDVAPGLAAPESPAAPPAVQDTGHPSPPQVPTPTPAPAPVPAPQGATPSTDEARVGHSGQRTAQTEQADRAASTEPEAGAQADRAGNPAPPAVETPATSQPRAGASPESVHVPLDGLLGAEQRTLPPQPAAPRPGPGPAPTLGASVATESAASTVSVVVLRGDSLWSLAARSLGQGATDAQIAVEWQRWFAANAEVIGQDPDLIRPGQVLVAPRTV